VLGELASEVYTIERIGSLAERARQTLQSLGYKNIKVVTGDGTIGIESAASFDRILITAAAPELPAPLVSQLADGGIIIAPVGDRRSSVLVKAQKLGNSLKKEYHTHCAFVPLIGEYGWKE
jgi:protein-L-isoaspartate(D-aspartate) O-methyltransferase